MIDDPDVRPSNGQAGALLEEAGPPIRPRDLFVLPILAVLVLVGALLAVHVLTSRPQGPRLWEKQATVKFFLKQPPPR